MLTTDLAIRKAKPQEKEYHIHADDKLFLRVRPDGSKAWIFRYQAPGGKAKKLSLGAYPDVSLQQAGDEAQRLRGMLQLGQDPQEAREETRAKIKAEERREAEGAFTVRDAFGYEDETGKKRTGWFKALKRSTDEGAATLAIFQKDVFPYIGHKPIREVTKSDILKCVRAARDRGSLRMSNRLLGLMKTFFRFVIAEAADDDWLSPADPVSREQAGGSDADTPCERHLTIEEIIELDNLLRQDRVGQLKEQSQRAIWLLLATGTRIEETTLAEWAHIDFERRTWWFPKENRKKIRGQPPRDHTVFLSDFAIEQLLAIKRLEEEFIVRMREKGKHVEKSKYVFPGTSGKTPLQRKWLTQQLYDRQHPAKRKHRNTSDFLVLRGGTWTPHDLRRTFATLAGELKVEQEVVDLCLSHMKSGVSGVYQRQVRQDDQREAWERVGLRLYELRAIASERN